MNIREIIKDSIQPSEWIPKEGDHFRIRYLMADRSYINYIYKALSSQNGAVLGLCVFPDYIVNQRILFIAGDVNFYDCGEIIEKLAEVEKA